MIRCEPAGAEALLLVLADEPDGDLPLQIANLAERIRVALGPLLIDLVPGWTTLLLHYDLRFTDHHGLAKCLQPLLDNWRSTGAADACMHEIPICYDGEDLALVAQACALTEAEVIALHTGRSYRVGAIGFAPGFAYLSELDARLVLPRRATPRTRVPAGSLAIAERQTAIYPQASPGGWHLLGRCPWRLFDPARTPPCLLRIGDRVRFVAIDAVRFKQEEQR
ncbi:5-oxoprolinase subunit PxpB [Azomonas macrocytogenes]|uniref:KipI family sensor histidine kinase inhibitor n=1 Tax=Azomonas macrocytogenes TaxID=69962 RepID=A0A839T0J9_AZOMA|nr:5-oxoprolinase subunit PxpB [Azomonas macrocytogenes]MBB3102050.1 KipI family sensor histidine kinase inhibitor [Azomonas macrocytogenes]